MNIKLNRLSVEQGTQIASQTLHASAMVCTPIADRDIPCGCLSVDSVGFCPPLRLHEHPQASSSLDNLGLKITQSFSSANWRWGAKGGGGVGAATPTKRQNPSFFRSKGIPAINEGTAATSDISTNKSSPRGDGLLGSQAQDKPLGVKKSMMGFKTVAGTLGGSNSSGGGSGAYGAGITAKGGGSGAGRGSGNPVPSISLSDLDGAESDTYGGDEFTPAAYGAGEEEEEEDEQEADAGSGGSIGALTCRRCGGTVEGPLHSTCVCKVSEESNLVFMSLLAGISVCATRILLV